MAGAQTGILDLPYTGSGTVTAQRFIKLTGDQTVARQDAAGGWGPGVAGTDVQNPNPQTGINEVANAKPVAVQAHGVAWVEAGAAITRGDEVATDNVGRAVTATTGDVVMGRCLKGAGAAGKLCLVLLNPVGYLAA